MIGILYVALGGAIGASLRYVLGLGAARALGPDYPYGTMGANVLGGFLMGLGYVLLVERGPASLAPAITTGLLGGFTTFSAFSLDAILLIEAGRTATAVFYIGASVLGSLLALWLGLIVARGL